MIVVYRDQPKPGETDAKWCAYETNGLRVLNITTGHETQEAARTALNGARIGQRELC